MLKALYLTAALMLTITIGLYVLRGKPFDLESTSDSTVPPIADVLPKPENPLLKASRAEFERWLPPYCGPDLYLGKATKPHTTQVCVHGTITRVLNSTGIQLMESDVKDPRVAERWRKTMGAN